MRFLSLLLLTATFTISTRSANAAPMSCDQLFFQSAEAVSPETMAKAGFEVTEADPKINESIAAMKVQFLKPSSLSSRVILTHVAKQLDNVTNFLTKFFAHSYPFSYITEGTVPKARLWSKQGDKNIQEEVETWMKRYSNYQMNRRLLVEQAFFVRNEAEQLKILLKRPEKDFPIEILTPKYLRGGLVQEKATYSSKKQVSDELGRIQISQATMFGGNYKHGRFLHGRDIEQAHLEARLKIVLRELKNNPFATTNPVLRREMIDQIDNLLKDSKNKASPQAQYVEARRALTDEIGYFTGRRELSYDAQQIVDAQLFQNDVYNLGLDRERLGILSRVARNLIVHAPNLIIGAAVVIYSPVIKNEVKQFIFQETVMREIAALPQKQYEERSLKFLKDVYGVKVVDGRPILDNSAMKALEKIKEDRKEHLNELREQNITQETFDLILNAEEKGPKISAEEFKVLMRLNAKQFSEVAHELASKQETEENAKNLMARLTKSYAAVHEPSEKKESEALLRDKIFDAFTGFVLGGGEKEVRE